MIRSHGVPESVIHTLKEEKIPFEDATCPFVKKIHKTVAEYSEKGYEIVIIGFGKTSGSTGDSRMGQKRWNRRRIEGRCPFI